MIGYQLDSFFQILSLPVLAWLYLLPLGVLYVINIVDTITGVMAAVRCKRFSWKVFIAGIFRFIFFYAAMWTIIFAIGIATSAIALLNVVLVFSGGLILTVSVTGIYSILAAVIVVSILENIQECETGKRNGFMGERRMFYDILKAPFKKVAKQESFTPPAFPTTPAAPTTTKGGDF